MKEIILKEKSMDKVNLFSLMDQYTKETLKWMKFQELVSISGPMVRYMKVNGRTTACMERVTKNGQMENSTRGTS